MIMFDIHPENAVQQQWQEVASEQCAICVAVREKPIPHAQSQGLVLW